MSDMDLSHGLILAGGLRTNQRTVTADTTMLENDHVIWADATAAAVTITFPSPLRHVGREFTVKRVAGANNVTLATAAGNIDGSATLVLTTLLMSRTVKSDGNVWRVIGGLL